VQYIASQAEHHRKISFQDELREILRKYRVAFDERYLPMGLMDLPRFQRCATLGDLS
jgi:hypothetical protein